GAVGRARELAQRAGRRLGARTEVPARGLQGCAFVVCGRGRERAALGARLLRAPRALGANATPDSAGAVFGGAAIEPVAVHFARTFLPAVRRAAGFRVASGFVDVLCFGPVVQAGLRRSRPFAGPWRPFAPRRAPLLALQRLDAARDLVFGRREAHRRLARQRSAYRARFRTVSSDVVERFVRIDVLRRRGAA